MYIEQRDVSYNEKRKDICIRPGIDKLSSCPTYVLGQVVGAAEDLPVAESEPESRD